MSSITVFCEYIKEIKKIWVYADWLYHLSDTKDGVHLSRQLLCQDRGLL